MAGPPTRRPAMPHADFDFLPLYAHKRVSQIYRDGLSLCRAHLDQDLRWAAESHGVAHAERTTELAHRWLLRRSPPYTKANTPPMPVYVPASDEGHGIARGSAIVSMAGPDAGGRITVWYEGNLYGAENLKHFEERLRSAAGRAATRYPTVALASLEACELKQVGVYHYATAKLELTDAKALETWLSRKCLPASA